MSNEKKISAKQISDYEKATLTLDGDETHLYRKMHFYSGLVAQVIWQDDSGVESFLQFLNVANVKKLSEQERGIMYFALFDMDTLLQPQYFAKQPVESVPQESDIKFVYSLAYHLLSTHPNTEKDGKQMMGGVNTRAAIAKTLDTLGLGEPLTEAEIFNESLSEKLSQLYAKILAYQETRDAMRAGKG